LGVVLSAAVRERLERARETLAVAAPARRYAGRAPVADALRRAAEERRTVEVVYEPLDGGRGRRLLDPYLIWFDPVGSALYVAGWAHDRREVRTFLVDRIRQVLATGRTFERAAGWDARAYLGEAFATFRGRAQDVRLHFSGRAARLVAERTWHPSQTARPRPGGQLELAMRVPLSPAFTGWVLSWMPEVRALAPLSLVRSVHDALVRGLVLEGRVAASREN
jgi:proteasome accessory factor B